MSSLLGFRSTYIAHKEWAVDVMRGAKSRAITASFAHEVNAQILNNIPVHTGSYRAHWLAGAALDQAITALGLPQVRIHMGDPRWHLIEFGNAKYADVPNPPYAPIRRGVTAAGLTWVQE